MAKRSYFFETEEVRFTFAGMFGRHQRHDGGGPDGDVLGAPEHDVDEAAHEGGVEAVLRLQARHQRVGDTWEVECLAQKVVAIPSGLMSRL